MRLFMNIQLSGYHIDNIIGQGGMATVYRAEHILLKQQRALKVMSPELTNQAGFKDSFICEGQFVAALKHPNIVSIYDISEQNGIYFMAMEYLQGGSLEEKLPLSLTGSIKVLQQIGSALYYAHQQQLIHRDIKPANILFNAQGDAILTDFGISKLQSTDSQLTVMGYSMIGTPRYMSPEQTSGEILDKRSDLYSLALVFYEMLSGKKAIKAKTTASIIHEHAVAPPPKLPEEFSFLQKTLDKALAKTPDKRYPDMLSFVQAVLREKANHDASFLEKQQQRKIIVRIATFSLITSTVVIAIGMNIDWKKTDDKPTEIKSTQLMADFPSKTKQENNEPIESKFKEPSQEKKLQHSTTELLRSTKQPEEAIEQPPLENKKAILTKPVIKTPKTTIDLSTITEPEKAPPILPIETEETATIEKIEITPSIYKTVRVSPYIVLYAQPHTKRIGQIPKGTRVEVTATTNTEEGKNWSKINFDGRQGYVKTSQLK